MITAVVIGKLIDAPDLCEVHDDQVCNLRLRSVRKLPSGAERSQIVSVAIWGSRAPSAADYFRKGDTLMVSGSLEANRDGHGNHILTLRPDRWERVEP